MANFIVRVRLHHAGVSDYDRLTRLLVRQGFRPTVSLGGDVEYQLPPGQYRIAGEYEGDEVLEAMYEIASGISAYPEVLVMECSVLYFKGLHVA